MGHPCTYQFVVIKFILNGASLLVTIFIKCGCCAARSHSVSSIKTDMSSCFSVKIGFSWVWNFIGSFYIGRDLKKQAEKTKQNYTA